MGPSFANEGDVGTEPELSVVMEPAGEPGTTRFDERGVAWSYSEGPIRLLLVGLASACRGVDVEGVTDPSESSDISEALEGDLERWNLSSVKASEPISLKGDSDRDSLSAMVTIIWYKLQSEER